VPMLRFFVFTSLPCLLIIASPLLLQLRKG
jgi:hypothetical protein